MTPPADEQRRSVQFVVAEQLIASANALDLYLAGKRPDWRVNLPIAHLLAIEAIMRRAGEIVHEIAEQE